MAFDDRGDAVGGPKVIVPPVRHRSLSQKPFELLELGSRESSRAMRVRFRGQGIGSLGGLAAPAIDRVAVHAQEFGNIDLPLPLPQQFQRPASPPFKFQGCTKRSAHTHLEGPKAAKDSLEAQLSIGEEKGTSYISPNLRCPLFFVHGSTSGTSRCFSANLNDHTFRCFKCQHWATPWIYGPPPRACRPTMQPWICATGSASPCQL